MASSQVISLIPSVDQRSSDALEQMPSPGIPDRNFGKGRASHQETTGLLLTSTWAGTSQGTVVKAKPSQNQVGFARKTILNNFENYMHMLMSWHVRTKEGG